MSSIPKRTSEPVSETRICVEVINWGGDLRKVGTGHREGRAAVKVCCACVCVCVSL